MKALKEYILESHGIVTNDNSWSELVKYIIDSQEEHIDDERLLPKWMNSVTLEYKSQGNSMESAVAAYDDSKSRLSPNNKLDVYINTGLSPTQGKGEALLVSLSQSLGAQVPRCNVSCVL